MLGGVGADSTHAWAHVGLPCPPAGCFSSRISSLSSAQLCTLESEPHLRPGSVMHTLV